MKLDGIFKKGLAFLAKYKYLFLVIAVGIVLMLLPTSFGGEDPQPSPSEVPEAEETASFSVEAEEQRLKALLEQIDGVGRVEVMITLSATSEKVYAQEQSHSTSQNLSDDGPGSYSDDLSQKPALTSQGSTGQQPIVEKTLYPQVQGVVIVCDGGDDAETKLNLLNSMAALLGLTSDRVTVLKMKK